MIKVKYENNRESYNEFAKYVVKNNRAMKVIYVCSAIILACSFIMFFAEELFEAFLYLFLGIFFACYGFVLKAIVNHQNKKGIGFTDEFEFYDDKMVVNNFDKQNTQTSSLTVFYKNLYKVDINKNYAYIFLNKNSAFIIEKNIFESEKTFCEVIKTINEKIEKESNPSSTENKKQNEENIGKSEGQPIEKEEVQAKSFSKNDKKPVLTTSRKRTSSKTKETKTTSNKSKSNQKKES